MPTRKGEKAGRFLGPRISACSGAITWRDKRPIYRTNSLSWKLENYMKDKSIDPQRPSLRPDGMPLEKLSLSQALLEVGERQRLCYLSALGVERFQQMIETAEQAAQDPLLDPVGLPVFECTISVNGSPVRLCTDLSLVEPEYLTHVLMPLCNVHSAQLVEQVQALQELVNFIQQKYLEATRDAK